MCRGNGAQRLALQHNLELLDVQLLDHVVEYCFAVIVQVVFGVGAGADAEARVIIAHNVTVQQSAQCEVIVDHFAQIDGAWPEEGMIRMSSVSSLASSKANR